MTVLGNLKEEKQRLQERLERMRPEFDEVSRQLSEIDVAIGVLDRLGSHEPAPRRGRPPGSRNRTESPSRNKTSPSRVGDSPSISDAVLSHVTNNPGCLQAEVAAALNHQYGMRANHVGRAIDSHRRAGRLELREGHWFPPQSDVDAEAGEDDDGAGNRQEMREAAE